MGQTIIDEKGDLCEINYHGGRKMSRLEEIKNNMTTWEPDDIRWLIEKLEECEKHLKKIKIGLGDWVVSYAPEFCDEKNIKKTKARISERGTLSYIGTLNVENEELLKSIREGK